MTCAPKSPCLTVTPTALSCAASQSPEMEGMAKTSESRAMKAEGEASTTGVPVGRVLCLSGESTRERSDKRWRVPFWE
jgi:hypothetical protein